jgi:hypothetical protein
MLVLKVIYSAILIFMIYATTDASLKLNLLTHLPTLIQDPWAVMTLYDAYFAFLFFYLWVHYKEDSILFRIFMFVMIVCLGTMAMSIYMLVQIFKLKENEGIETLLLKKASK